MHVSPWIHNAAHPDTSSVKRFLAHERFRGKQGEALAIALWHYTVDPLVGFYHFWSPSDRDMERPYVRLDYVKDPLKLINSYGNMLCGTVASVHVHLCEAAGLQARVVGITGHTVNEIYFDGAWHLFDCDMRGYYRKREAPHAIASLRECLKDPTLISKPVESMEAYTLPGDTAQGISDGCYAPGFGDEFPRFVQHFHSMDYLLRPGETLTRYAAPKGRWHLPPHWITEGGKRYSPEMQQAGPREKHPPHRTYYNGVFEYRPNLTSASRDLELGAWSIENAAATPAGLALQDAAKPSGRVTFLLHSPWVIAGKTDDPMDSAKKSQGALAELEVVLPPGKQGHVALRLSLDGNRWEEIARVSESRSIQADFTRALDRRHRALLALEIQGGAIVKKFDTTAWIQLSHNSYPYLSERGETAFQYHGGDEAGGRSLTEPWFANVECEAGAFDQLMCSATNLKRGPSPQERLLPVDPTRPWSAVFCVKPQVFAGRPILRAWLWASVASVKGDPDAPTAEYLRQKPFASLEAALSPQGPWSPVAKTGVPLHKNGYHFNLDGDFVPPGKDVQEIYMRVSASTPASEIRAALTCGLPELKGGTLPPLEMVHQWKEDGQAREHLETVRDPSKAFQYNVTSGKGAIENTAVIFRVPSTKR